MPEGPRKPTTWPWVRALANDVANFRVHIAKDDLVFVRKADVVNLKKRFA